MPKKTKQFGYNGPTVPESMEDGRSYKYYMGY